MCHYSFQRTFPPNHPSHVTSHSLVLHSLSSTSSSCTHHPSVTLHLIPEISVGQSMWENISVSLLTCPPRPNGYPFVQIIPFFTISSPFTIQTPLKPSSSLIFPLQPPLIPGNYSQHHSFSDFCRYQSN
jgi:hypothetical protein